MLAGFKILVVSFVKKNTLKQALYVKEKYKEQKNHKNNQSKP